ncbi:helix-turn-helix domain-containing protein [Candidatus Poribacteria bacterium]|nr:helix-turn-helix domain-containing protein [Candidatus Poribacteria bacterium]
MRNFRTLHEFLMEGLANNDEAIDFLKVALEEYQEDDDTPFFLKSIRTVIEAQIGISELAKRTHMSPDALQKILSSDKAPHIDTLGTIFNALGCRLSVEPLETDIACSDTEVE